jgi:Putative restriction endonuclease
MMAASPRLVTLTAGRLAFPGRARMEAIGGTLGEIPASTAEYADALLGLGEVLRHHFHRRGNPTTGGWWILTKVDVEMDDGEVVRPDLVGWRRSRVPERPRGRRLRARPDWICQVVPSFGASPNPIATFRAFHRQAVPHCWLVDPERGTLTAHQWTPSGYTVALRADRWQFVRAEPFDAIEIRMGTLFGEEPDPQGECR